MSLDEAGLLRQDQQDGALTRREYLRLLVVMSGALVAGTIGVASGMFRRSQPDRAAAMRIAESLAPGEAVAFSFPGPDDPAIAVRFRDGGLVAYSSACTHLRCPVVWVAQREHLLCPCHQGLFDPRTGGVVAGPPPRPLPGLRIEQRVDGIYVMGVER